MLCPGVYSPDPTVGITDPQDLPAPKLISRSRNYEHRPCPQCGKSPLGWGLLFLHGHAKPKIDDWIDSKSIARRRTSPEVVFADGDQGPGRHLLNRPTRGNPNCIFVRPVQSDRIALPAFPVERNDITLVIPVEQRRSAIERAVRVHV